MDNAPITVQSIEELRRKITRILHALNADPALLRAAAANPIFALEEIGYFVPRELHRELDRRVRFTAAERERLALLTRKMHEAAGATFDPDDAEQLDETLFARLELPRLPEAPVRVTLPVPDRGPDTVREGAVHAAPPRTASRSRAALPEPAARTIAATHVLHPLDVRYHLADATRDPLHALADAHPIMAPLLEYRAIMARHAPFASRELYERIRRDTTGGVRFTLRARLHRKKEG